MKGVIILLAKEEYQLIIGISESYYVQGKTQSRIADELYISRTKVSRLLKKARELNIVEVRLMVIGIPVKSFNLFEVTC